jgi:hypothetical protein
VFWAEYAAGGLDFAGKNQYAGNENFHIRIGAMFA